MKNERISVVVIFDISLKRIVAKQFSRFEAEILITQKASDGINVLKEVLNKGRGQSISIDIDPLDSNAMEKGALLIEKVLGPVDIWINHLARSVELEQEEEDDERLLDHEKVIEKYYLMKIYSIMSALNTMYSRNRSVKIFVSPGLFYKDNGKNTSLSKHIFFQLVKAEFERGESLVDVRPVPEPRVINGPDTLNLLSKKYPNNYQEVNLWQFALEAILENRYKDRIGY